MATSTLPKGSRPSSVRIQRSAYGYRDEDYLRLKVIASFLPPLPENAKIHPH
ncbi:MAG TPA: hypothetical protein VFN09_03560 [Rhodanobacteraceae bacterium]|nr:hypothetical protein [Rhodanobacteraceae bacterium]